MNEQNGIWLSKSLVLVLGINSIQAYYCNQSTYLVNIGCKPNTLNIDRILKKTFIYACLHLLGYSLTHLSLLASFVSLVSLQLTRREVVAFSKPSHSPIMCNKWFRCQHTNCREILREGDTWYGALVEKMVSANQAQFTV